MSMHFFEMWRSLVAHLLWEQRAAGSNPAISIVLYTPKGIRIPVISVKRKRPRPLDDEGVNFVFGLPGIRTQNLSVKSRLLYP